MLEFCPPKDSPLLIGSVKLAWPLLMHFGMRGTTVQIVGDGLARFKELAGKRTVITPNHPSRYDPEIMFDFSRTVGEDFNFLAAREVFEWNHGWNGWLLQHMGCYSVVRGSPDRESFKTTRKMIVDGKKKLVIFPEGEISSQNDTLMSLESGVAQMSFWALDELQKTDPTAPVFLLPIALKYIYPEDIHQELESSLWKIENRLGIRSTHSDPLYYRLRVVSDNLLGSLEREYGCPPPDGATINDRIELLKTFVLKRVASFLQIELPEKSTHLEWIRILRNQLDDFVYADEEEISPYERNLHEQKVVQYKGFYRDLDRIVNFIAIYDGYIRERMSQERFIDVLDRFETEVFEHSLLRSPRTALIYVGHPINLLEHYGDYRRNKRETLQKVNQELAQQISQGLESMDKERSAILVS